MSDSGAMPEAGTEEYEALSQETGGASENEGFDYAAHQAAMNEIANQPDERDDFEADENHDDSPDVNQQDDSNTGYDSRFDTLEDAIEFAENNGQGELVRGDDGTLRNRFGEEMVYDSDGNLAPKPQDPEALFPTPGPAPMPPGFVPDDQFVDPRAPEYSIPMPPVGSPEYEALLFETGGASAYDGFNYQAHLAATGQLDKLLELDPEYDPDRDPTFDGDFEAPFDEFSPERLIDRDALTGAETFEAFITASNGVDVGALGALLTPAEIAEVIAKFGDDPEFDAFISGPTPTGPEPTDTSPPFATDDPNNPAIPPVFVPSEASLGAIRGGGRGDKKAAVLELFNEAGNFDAFASGLASNLTPAEIDALISELADDAEVWSTLGMEMPPMSASESTSSIPLPPVGSAEYEALLFETGGASANPGFDYQAHLAATGQLDKLLELDPDYNPDLDPSFDGDFEAPFDEFSPERLIDRSALVGAESFEAFLAASNGADVGALGALLTPEEIAEVIEKFGDDAAFKAFIGAPIDPDVGEDASGLELPDVPDVTPPRLFIPPDEKLGAIRAGGREEKKTAILELFTDAGDFDSFANGLAATLSSEELDALIRDLADDDEVWETLGIERPSLPADADLTELETPENTPEVVPVFVPREEDLSVIRTADKDTKKGAIFQLLDESGSVDAFLDGLGSALAPTEIDALAQEFAEDADIWEALGIPQPERAPSGSSEVFVGEEELFDAPLDIESELALVGLGEPQVV